MTAISKSMDELHHVRSEIQSNGSVFKYLLSNASPALQEFREEEGKWNLKEIVCHLLDEEQEDFRLRLQSVLKDPLPPFKPIDPAGWVVSRSYSAADYQQKVHEFLEERKKSSEYLESLSPDSPFSNTYQHPVLGPMSGAFLLNNWLAHDYLHIRQIVRVKFAFLKSGFGTPLNYAGEW